MTSLATGFLQAAGAAEAWIGPQSALLFAGEGSEAIGRIGLVMFWGGGIILTIVMVFVAMATLAPDRVRWTMGRAPFIVGMGIVLPVIALTALLTWGLTVARGLAANDPPVLRIAVIGEQWWWRVQYLGPEGEVRLETANVLHLPVGAPVDIVLRTADVIHSFWVPSLAGKLDMIPGRENVLRMRAERTGLFRGQCAEFCGAQHALMAFHVSVLDVEDFEAWWAKETEPAREPVEPLRQAGERLFIETGCGACHTVRGTAAAGVLGPDLTHVGSRPSLAAGTLPNTVGALAGWIASAQHLKPANRMPSFAQLGGRELRAIADYLAGLR